MSTELVPLPEQRGGLTLKETMEALDEIRQLIRESMKEGVDYGTIPGTNNKNNLLLPGAQKVLLKFNCRPDFETTATELGNGHVEFKVKCRAISRNTGQEVGQGEASCSTMESKYRYRNAERTCPSCSSASIIKGNPKYAPKDRHTGELEPGFDKGGYICWKKKGGCGKVFVDADPDIINQTAGKVENDNIYDSRNTVLKMAIKRALMHTAIGLGCVSDFFTQDMEDHMAPPENPAPPPPSSAKRTPAPKKELSKEEKLSYLKTHIPEAYSRDKLAVLVQKAKDAGLSEEIKAEVQSRTKQLFWREILEASTEQQLEQIEDAIHAYKQDGSLTDDQQTELYGELEVRLKQIQEDTKVF